MKTKWMLSVVVAGLFFASLVQAEDVTLTPSEVYVTCNANGYRADLSSPTGTSYVGGPLGGGAGMLYGECTTYTWLKYQIPTIGSGYKITSVKINIGPITDSWVTLVPTALPNPGIMVTRVANDSFNGDSFPGVNSGYGPASWPMTFAHGQNPSSEYIINRNGSWDTTVSTWGGIDTGVVSSDITSWLSIAGEGPGTTLSVVITVDRNTMQAMSGLSFNTPTLTVTKTKTSLAGEKTLTPSEVYVTCNANGYRADLSSSTGTSYVGGIMGGGAGMLYGECITYTWLKYQIPTIDSGYAITSAKINIGPITNNWVTLVPTALPNPGIMVTRVANDSFNGGSFPGVNSGYGPASWPMTFASGQNPSSEFVINRNGSWDTTVSTWGGIDTGVVSSDITSWLSIAGEGPGTTLSVVITEDRYYMNAVSGLYFATPTLTVNAGIVPVTFSPVGGIYSSAQTVTMTSTEGATIRYTTDGSDPSATHGTPISSGGSVLVDHKLTLKAVAVLDGVASPIFSAMYTMQHQNTAFNVPAIASINVNGNLNDWSASTEWSEEYILWGTMLPSETRAKFAYNPDAGMLYVAIRTNQLNGGHAVVGISTNIDAAAWSEVGNDATQLGFHAVSDENGLHAEVINEITEYSKSGTDPDGFNHQITEITAAVAQGGDNYYTYEIAIPVWTNWITPQNKADLRAGGILYVYSMMQDTFGTSNGMDMTYYGNPGFAGPGGFHSAAILTLQARVPGDANGDRKVDVSDLGILAANYGTTAIATWAMGDFNHDGKVDVSDLGILAANYGTGTGATLDFNKDAGALGLTVGDDLSSAKADTPVTSTLACGSAGLPLIAGILLTGLLLGGLKFKE